MFARVRVVTVAFVLVLLLFCFLAYQAGVRNTSKFKLPNFSSSSSSSSRVRETREYFNAPTILRTAPEDPNEPWVETISWNPRIFIYHNFISQEECEKIIDIAQSDITRSLVVGKSGSDQSDVRTSNGVFADYKHMSLSPLLRNMEKRIAEWTKLPIENGESFYIIRYEGGEKYEPHMDYFSYDEIGLKHMDKAGNRIATVLTYLHAPEEGGETTFPRLDLKVKVKAGDAVLFWDMDPSNEVDPLTLHGSAPVVKGVKWAMPKWIRENPTYRWDGGLSQNEREQFDKEEREWLISRTNRGRRVPNTSVVD